MILGGGDSAQKRSILPVTFYGRRVMRDTYLKRRIVIPQTDELVSKLRLDDILAWITILTQKQKHPKCEVDVKGLARLPKFQI